VGLIIGTFLALLGLLKTPLTPLLQTIYLMTITGALHLDGLADTADALFSHKIRDKKLEIMKDSRIGTMGAVALIVVLLAKYIAFKEIDNFYELLFVPAYSRFSMVAGIYFLPYARKDGFNRNFFKTQSISVFIPGLIIMLLSIICGLAFFYLINTLFISLVIAVLFFYWKSVQGVTGDMLGACCEISETSLLLAVALI